jgi:hypothetical protein
MNHKIAWKNVNQWPFYGINFYRLCLKSVSSPGYDKNETEVWQTNVNCLIGYTGYVVGKRMYMCSTSPSQQPAPHCTHSKYEEHLESKERFAIKKYLFIIGKKKNMQVLSHTFTYFPT